MGISNYRMSYDLADHPESVNDDAFEEIIDINSRQMSRRNIIKK